MVIAGIMHKDCPNSLISIFINNYLPILLYTTCHSIHKHTYTSRDSYLDKSRDS